MAERRMFAKSVLLLGVFPELSRTAQVLYILLNMQADDDGLVGNTAPVLRMVRCTRRHLQELIRAGLLLEFPGGPVAITHWLIHNQIRKDRYKPTMLQEEYLQLTKTESGKYRFLGPEERLSSGCQNDTHLATQVRIGKDRLGEEREGKKSTGDQGLPPEAGSSSSSYTDFEKLVFDFYRNHCGKLMVCRYLDENIRANIGSLEKKGWTAERLETAFRRAGECAFLQGENERGWKADLEWLCREDNLQKVCAGKYERYQKEEVPCGATGGLGAAEREAIAKLLRGD